MAPLPIPEPSREPSSERSPDLSPEDFRRLGHRAIDLIADRLASVREDPVRRPVDDAQRTRWATEPAPAAGRDPDGVLDRVATELFPHPMGNAHPRFFAWVNSPPAPLGVIADLLASALDPSVAGGDHAATYVEHAVLGWLKTITGYPRESGAVLTSGGSVATLVGLAVMRHVKSGGTDRAAGVRQVPSQSASPLVIYTSTQGHSCIQKAVELIGLGTDHLRRVATDADFRMDVDALRRQIADDRARGLSPACVVASAGTVNTGAIDPIDAIADLCEAEGLWLHVDGAYGAVARLTDETNTLFRGLERADSLGLDAHKWLYMPVECGCALVRDARAMRDTFSVVPPYLRDDTAWPWFSEFTIQQTRGFKALKLWMVIQQIGLDGYRASIARDIALARALQARIRARDDFELVAAGPLSITCFRYVPPNAPNGSAEGEMRAANANASAAASTSTTADVDALNRSLLDIVQREGRTFLTQTELNGRPVLRACIVNFRTTEADLDILLDTIADAGYRSMQSSGGSPCQTHARP